MSIQVKALSFLFLVGGNGPIKSMAMHTIGQFGIEVMKSTYFGSLKLTLLHALHFLIYALMSLCIPLQKYLWQTNINVFKSPGCAKISWTS